MIQRYDNPSNALEMRKEFLGEYVTYSDYYAMEQKYIAMLTDVYHLVGSQIEELGG